MSLLLEGTIAQVYSTLLQRILVGGSISDATDSLLVHSARNLNYRFAIAEALWILNGQNDLESLTKYNKKYAEFSDDGLTLAGAYGPRLKSQISHVVNSLRKDRDSRQAVATIWTPNPIRSKDIPCTISAQFLIRHGELYSIWNMRSSDAWLGLPYDLFSFGLYTNYIAAVLDIPTGPMQLNLGSSHLYQPHLDAAREVPLTDGGYVRIPKFWEAIDTLIAARDEPTKADCLARLIENWGFYA
jgi:thymidylate synthase